MNGREPGAARCARQAGTGVGEKAGRLVFAARSSRTDQPDAQERKHQPPDEKLGPPQREGGGLAHRPGSSGAVHALRQELATLQSGWAATAATLAPSPKPSRVRRPTSALPPRPPWRWPAGSLLGRRETCALHRESAGQARRQVAPSPPTPAAHTPAPAQGWRDLLRRSHAAAACVTEPPCRAVHNVALAAESVADSPEPGLRRSRAATRPQW